MAVDFARRALRAAPDDPGVLGRAAMVLGRFGEDIDGPEILPSSTRPFCLVGADVGQSGGYQPATYARQPADMVSPFRRPAFDSGTGFRCRHRGRSMPTRASPLRSWLCVAIELVPHFF